MNEECLICKAPLIYANKEEMMECCVCHKKEMSRTKCQAGHYVCSDCHTQGIDSIIGVCLESKSKNPYKIFKQLFSLPFCHTHGPEHHILVGASLLTAYKNAGGEINLESALVEMQVRGKKVPGGACGFWGACGAGISAGTFVSIITESTPLKIKPWGQSNQMTAFALMKIGEIGGPRCCKRNSYIAITEAVKFVKEKFGVEMELEKIACSTKKFNNQCIKERCPFY